MTEHHGQNQYRTTPEPPIHPAEPVRRRRGLTVAVAGTLALAVGLGGVAIGQTVGARTVTGNGTPAAGSTPTGQFDWGDRYGNGTGGFGTGTGDGSGTEDGSGTGTTREATDAESVGVVDITTVIDYGSAEAAGTGIVLTSNGEILTNNHVVDGATKITVTVVSTGRSYSAGVVGTDAGDDVAVLQLAGASGLKTATLDDDTVAVGDAVTAVGNAGGTGGTPTAATGTVVALDQSITAGDETGSDSEQLTGMIEVNAAIEAGDSGGPLYDSEGEVIGIDTAASSGRSATTVGFAIPIAKAVAIADRIESGEDSETIQQGTPAFLGIQLTQDAAGSATISGVVDGSPAADAGLQAGDTITAVNGSAVDTADALSTALATYDAGDRVRITWVDTTGTGHTATVTLVAGPAA
jgi:S1-C subfamily serine protease